MVNVSVEQEVHNEEVMIVLPWQECLSQYVLWQCNQFVEYVPEVKANRREIVSPLLMMGYL